MRRRARIYKGGTASGGGGDIPGTGVIGDDWGSRTDGLSAKVQTSLSEQLYVKPRNDVLMSLTEQFRIATRNDVLITPSGQINIVARNDVSLNQTLTVAMTTSLLASKDTWVPEVAGCVDDANKDGTDLSIEQVVATRKDAYMAWDLTSLDFNGTVSVTEAYLTYNVKTLATVNAAAVLNHIPNADETWGETTFSCNDTPTLTSFQTLVAGDTSTTGDHTITLNSTARDRIRDRLGVGNYSIAMIGGIGQVGAMTLQATDSAGTPANGPRLRIVVQVS